MLTILHLRAATFAQCMIGGESQKYTTLWYTPGMGTLDSLRGMWCSHPLGTHAQPAGGHYDSTSGKWNSAQAAAYPADMNALLADALVDSMVAREIFSSPVSRLRSTRPLEVSRTPTTSTNVSVAIEREQAPTSGGEDVQDDRARLLPSHHEGGAKDEPADASISDEQPSPMAPKPPRRRKGPDDYFKRTLGAYGTRTAVGAVKQSRMTGNEPVSHAHAMRLDAPGWSAAEASEIANHEDKQSWEYVPRTELPAGRRVIRLTWAYKVKRTGKYKARLCVQGCAQVPGVDFDQTYCAAMRAGSLRTLCAIAARLSLRMFRWDFVAAYLQGELESGEVVYCSAPSGYATASVDGKVRLVRADDGDGVERLCKVVRPVYGMAQAGKGDGRGHSSRGSSHGRTGGHS